MTYTPRSAFLAVSVIAGFAWAGQPVAPPPPTALAKTAPPVKLDVKALDRDRVLKAAAAYLKDEPVTVTAAQSPRSAGGPHDFFSEGDYWWPDPNNPGGPYIQRDGM